MEFYHLWIKYLNPTIRPQVTPRQIMWFLFSLHQNLNGFQARGKFFCVAVTHTSNGHGIPQATFETIGKNKITFVVITHFLLSFVPRDSTGSLHHCKSPPFFCLFVLFLFYIV